jgi:penicillin-binding protein 1A
MKWFVSFLKFLMSLAFTAVLLGTGVLVAAYLYLEPTLPSTESLRDVRLQVPLRVYSRDGRLIAEFGEMRRIPLSLAEIPESLVKAVLAAEDDRFYEHPGIDYQSLARAALQLAKTGERRQGGSTITMQVARNFFLSSEKTFARKLTEILLALRIERELTKDEILALYLNKIYLGHRAYGVGAAAQIYYGKTVMELDLAEIAMIAGLPKAPSRYNPIADPERALQRRNYILGRMRDLGYVGAEAYANALKSPETARVQLAPVELDAPYVAEMARSEMVDRFGPDAYTNGYRVYTTLDSRLQPLALRVLRDNLEVYDQRHGYRGAEARLQRPLLSRAEAIEVALADLRVIGGLRPAVVTGLEDKERRAELRLSGGERVVVEWEALSWARRYLDENRQGPLPKKPSDVLAEGDIVRVRQVSDAKGTRWRLAQVPEVEGAFVALDPATGAIRALVGGYDFDRNKFNRVVQAQRQPGSGFKPFVYSAALEAGFSPASVIDDSPLEIWEPGMPQAWRPENYDGAYKGPMRMREALVQSRNLVSIRLLKAVGVSKALDHIRAFGFDPATLPHNLTLALGTATLSPLDMARGFGILANGGYRIQPYLLERVEEEGRPPVYQAEPETVCADCAGSRTAGGAPVAPRVLSAENAYMVSSMLQDVTKRGTAAAARVLNRKDIAGKTGTTNEWRDTWFNGYSPTLVAVSWVGFDSMKPLGKGETGGKTALPAWIAFMREALEGVPDIPPPMPSGVVAVRIDPATGMRLGAGQGGVFEVFRANAVPEVGGVAEGGEALLGDGSAEGTGGGRASRAAPLEDLF